MTTTLSVRIGVDTKKRLEALAKRARRSKSVLAAEAIAAFVEAESWQLDEIQGEPAQALRILRQAERLRDVAARALDGALRRLAKAEAKASRHRG